MKRLPMARPILERRRRRKNKIAQRMTKLNEVDKNGQKCTKMDKCKQTCTNMHKHNTDKHGQTHTNMEMKWTSIEL